MKYSVGLQHTRPAFLQCIGENAQHIREVYFSWGDFPNGRSSQTSGEEFAPWQLQAQQEAALETVSSCGIPLNLLFNATCYGADSQSRAFFNRVGQTVDYIEGRFGLESVTTTSPPDRQIHQGQFSPDQDPCLCQYGDRHGSGHGLSCRLV